MRCQFRNAYPELCERVDPIRHQAFTARFVDGRRAAVCNSDIKSSLSPGECGRQSAGTTSDDEHVIFTFAQSVHHSSATSSEQKPGPMAASRPKVPGSGRRFFMTSSSTTNTDADERFPTRRRQSHEASSCPLLRLS